MSTTKVNFKNRIDESFNNETKQTVVSMVMEISVQAESLDHATKLCKKITNAVDKAVAPEYGDGREI